MASAMAPLLRVFALGVVGLHGQHVGAHHQHVALIHLDALLKVFGQRALARATLTHHRHKAVVLGAVKQRGAHVAHARALENVVGALHVVDERVARQFEVLACLGAEGLVLQ